jgi:TRAP-type C4-dicarboxylate transport system substrate-binding protein
MRRNLITAVAVAGALSLGAAAASANTVLKLGTVAFPGIPLGDSMQEALVDNINTISGGKLTIEPHYRGSICGEQKCGEQANQGLLALWTSSTANFGNFGTALAIFDLPYLFKTLSDADKVANGWLGDARCEVAANTTQHRCFEIFASGGFRHLGNAKGPVHHPDDLKGVKMRVTKSPIEYTLIKAWGAVPIPYDWTQLYQGLQTGVVEGQYVQVPWQRIAKLHEVTKYYTGIGGSWGGNHISMDLRQYKKLSDQEKGWLRKAMTEYGDVARARDQAWVIETTEKMKTEITEWYDPNPEEMTAWRKGAIGAWKKAKGTYDGKQAERALAEQGLDGFIVALKQAGAL